MQNGLDTIESRRCRLRKQVVSVKIRYYRKPESRSLSESLDLECLDKEGEVCKKTGCKFYGGGIEPFEGKK